ncbi:hypothetical protein [Achromobacter sp. AGC39]
MTQLNDTIRAVFLAHGFTIKDGQTDLKPYVYEAAHALLSTLRAQLTDERAEHVETLRRMRADYKPSDGPMSALKAAALDAALSALASAPVAGEAVAWMAKPVMSSGRGSTTVFCSDRRLADQWDYGGHPEFGRMIVTPLYAEPHASKKPHEVAELINKLRDIAIQFHGSQQLRERIAQELRPLFAPQASKAPRA